MSEEIARDPCWKRRGATGQKDCGESAPNKSNYTQAAPSTSPHVRDSTEFPSATSTIPHASQLIYQIRHEREWPHVDTRPVSCNNKKHTYSWPQNNPKLGIASLGRGLRFSFLRAVVTRDCRAEHPCPCGGGSGLGGWRILLAKPPPWPGRLTSRRTRGHSRDRHPAALRGLWG